MTHPARRLEWAFSYGLLATDNHGQQCFGNQCHHHQVDRDERHQQCHRDEMYMARTFVAPEQFTQQRELHRLPQHQPGDHQQRDIDHHEQVRQPLHLVVMIQVGMSQLAAQRGPEVMQHAFGRDREKAPLQAPAEQVAGQVDEAVDGQEPHRREVPLQGAAQPTAEGDAFGKTEIVKRGSVVDAPTTGDHDQHGECVEPVGQA